MHLLSTRPGGFVEDDSIITRLDQTPAEMVVLSSADTTLSLLADAYRLWLQSEAPRAVPTLRLANLLHLRQSASLDLYIDEVLQHARLVIVDHLGAESAWPYGIEQLRKLALQRGQQLAMFSGDSQEDAELLAKGTLAPAQSRALWPRIARTRGSSTTVGSCSVNGQRIVELSVSVSSRPARNGASAA